MYLKKMLVILILNFLILLTSVTTRAEEIHYLGSTVINPTWEELQEEQEEPEKENKEVSIDNNRSSSSDVNSGDSTSSSHDRSYITTTIIKKTASIGFEDLYKKFGLGVDYSICDLYPSKEAEKKTRHWGVDLFVLLPISKCFYLGLGGGWYCYSADSIGFSWDDECTNSGGLIDLQYFAGKYLIGYGYHSVKGHFLRIGSRL